MVDLKPIVVGPELLAMVHSSINIARFCVVAAYSLQLYDWLLTLSEEVELIYQTRWSSIKISYLLCRYYPLVVYPLLMWAWLGDHEKSLCDRLVHPIYASLIPFQLVSQAIILIRAYAFTGRNIWVSLVLGPAFLALLSAEVWLFGTQFLIPRGLFELIPRTGCFGDDAHIGPHRDGRYGRALNVGLVILSVFVLDLLALIVVIVHCVRTASIQGRLGRLFLIQTTGVFFIMTCLYLLSASTFIGGLRRWDGIGIQILLILSDVLACRLILQLRRRASPTESQIQSESSRLVREGLERVHAVQDEWA